MLTRPAVLLKMEDAVILFAALAAYSHFHFSWLFFAILFLAPDLSMFGYMAGPRVGAATYNLFHTLTPPLVLSVVGRSRHFPHLFALAIIWVAHIAMDRVLGYGLKYPTFFKDTHLQHLAPVRE